ncbi:MAG: diguanylate cyclase [Rhodospirillales bacterium]|nr:diguanylate cyclase [Rhodospirillales bacterium]MBO6788326.1 diguanylate cyclase [Rhodospirillales bacterium]
MLSFLSVDQLSQQPLSATYDAALVAASYLVAAVAAFSGLRLARYAEHDGTYNWRWLFVGALTMGFGVWSMHFIGMLAFKLPIPVSYSSSLTALSVVPAIVGCMAGLALLRKDLPLRDDVRRLIAGTIIGAGIGAMHYIGMAAMRMNAALFYDQTWFILSIAVAVVLGVVGVYAEKLREFEATSWAALPFQIASAAILGLSIAGMHYVAMQAAICIPTLGSGAYVAGIISPLVLAANVSGASILIALLGLVAIKVDAKMRHAQKHARLTEERMYAAIESISDGFLLFDENGKLLLHNGVFAQMYPSLQDLLVEGVTYEEILRGWAEGRETFPEGLDRETYIRKCLEAFESRRAPLSQSDEDQLFDGRWAVVRQSPVKVGGMVSVWHDVTAIKKQQDIYRELALTDGLTKLPNRTAFTQRLDDAIKRNKRADKKVALMFIDLDKFKPVNDKYGHDAGDHVLVTISERLSRMIRETDMAARIGGDEFVVILEQVSDSGDIETIAEKILAGIREPILFNGIDCSVGGSIGIAVNPDHAVDTDDLMKAADEAMYEVKESGRNNYRIFSGVPGKQAAAAC